MNGGNVMNDISTIDCKAKSECGAGRNQAKPCRKMTFYTEVYLFAIKIF
jgi:hypothetical protein